MIASLIAMSAALMVTTVTQTRLIKNMVVTTMMTAVMMTTMRVMTTMMVVTTMMTIRRSQRNRRRKAPWITRLGADRSVKRMAKLGMICSIANPSVMTRLVMTRLVMTRLVITHLRIVCASLNAWLL